MDNSGMISTPTLCTLYAKFSLTSVYFVGKEPIVSGAQSDTLPEPKNCLSAEQLSLFADILCASQYALPQSKAVSKLSSLNDTLLFYCREP